MSPTPTEETHAAIQLPTDVWEFIGWAIKGVITICFGWVAVLIKDVRSLKTWRSTQSVLAEVRDQQRTEILEIVKEVRDDIKRIAEDHGERIATLEGINEGKDR